MAISTEYWNRIVLNAIEQHPYEEHVALAEKCGGDIYKNWRLKQKQMHKIEIKRAQEDYEV